MHGQIAKSVTVGHVVDQVGAGVHSSGAVHVAKSTQRLKPHMEMELGMFDGLVVAQPHMSSLESKAVSTRLSRLARCSTFAALHLTSRC